MKRSNNQICIGNGNKIKGSIIGQNNHIQAESLKHDSNAINILWKLLVPVIVIVIAAVVCSYLGV